MIYRVKTFEDIIQAVITRGKLNPNSEEVVNQVKQKINVAQTDICFDKPYRFTGDTRPLVIKARVTTGTAALTQGSSNVTGTGTSWTADMVGRKFIVPGQKQFYKIVRVASATSLTINPAFIEDSNATSNYVIYQDEYGLYPDCQGVRTIYTPDVPYPLNPISIREMDTAKSYCPDYVGAPRFYTVNGNTFYRQKTWQNWLLGTDFFEDSPNIVNGRQKKLILSHTPNAKDMCLTIRYTRVCPDLIENDDEPLIPYESRYILVLGVLVTNFIQERDFVTKREWKSEYEGYLKKLAGDIETTDDQLILKPSVYKFNWTPSSYGSGNFRRRW